MLYLSLGAICNAGMTHIEGVSAVTYFTFFMCDNVPVLKLICNTPY